MGSDLGLDTLSRLLQLRVAVAGAGAFRVRRKAGTGAYEGTCVLPGHGTFVRLFEGPRGCPMAQMHYSDGRPLSAEIDLRRPDGFAALMHNADVEIWRGGCADPLPTEIRALVDAAVASGDESVVGAVEDAYRQGATTEFPDLAEAWEPTDEAKRFVAACAASADPAVAEAAARLEAVMRGETATEPFDSRASLDRWRRTAASLSSGGAPPPTAGRSPR